MRSDVTKIVIGCYIKDMRLLTIFFMAVFFHVQLPAQNYPVDSLKKYSYYVFGKQPTPDGKAMQAVEGTCFFARAGSRLFLVSAKHLMTSWSTADAEKQLLYPDTLFVRLPSTNKQKYTDVAIDIRAKKQQVTGDFYYNEADVFVMPFSDSAVNTVHAIALTDIDSSILPTNTQSVIHGFPAAGPFYLEGHVYSSPAENITYRDNKRDAAVRDTINYLVKCEGAVQGGYSGAPVFIKKEEGSGWSFGGIVSQGVAIENYFFVVKPAFVLSEINRFL